MSGVIVYGRGRSPSRPPAHAREGGGVDGDGDGDGDRGGKEKCGHGVGMHEDGALGQGCRH